MRDRESTWFLTEEPSRTVFDGDVLEIDGAQTEPFYNVQNGGWSSDGPNCPDTWLTDHVLKRFNGRRVRVTIEDLGPSVRYPLE